MNTANEILRMMNKNIYEEEKNKEKIKKMTQQTIEKMKGSTHWDRLKKYMKYGQKISFNKE